MTTKSTDEWVCTKCGHTFGRHDMWYEGDVCESCANEKPNTIDEVIEKITEDLDNGKIRGLQGLLDKLPIETLQLFIDGEYDG